MAAPGRPGDEGHLGRRIGRAQPQQFVKHPRSGFGVGAGPVRLAVVQAKMLRQRGQVVLRYGGQKHRRQVPGVVAGVGQVQPVRLQKAQVKGDVVADDGQVPEEVCKLAGHPTEGRRPRNLLRRDGRELLNERRYLPTGIDESLVTFQHLVAPELDGPHLDDGVGVGVQPGGLQVDADELSLEDVARWRQRWRHGHVGSTRCPGPFYTERIRYGRGDPWRRPSSGRKSPRCSAARN